MAEYTINKCNETFYLCEPFGMVYDQEIFLSDLESEIKQLQKTISEMDI